jgi:3-oxoacyl-[acyl-carrier-protein] synthase-3
VATNGGHVAIAGVGHYTPNVVLTNDEIVARFDLRVDASWIEDRTGILERHWMSEGETTSDMVAAAARKILAATDTRPRDVDLFVLATVSPDLPSPATATIAARKLGLACPAFDVSAACAGLFYALEIASNAVKAGGKRRVLVVCADARSRYVDPRDHRSVVLFADAAAGCLVVPSASPGLLAVRTGAEGRERMGAWIAAGGAARPTTAETVAAGGHYLQVDGRNEIFDVFVGYTRRICDEALAAAGVGWSDVDLFIPHQGNARLVETIVAAVGVPPEKTMNTIARHGNVSGATVALALSEAAASGRIRPGDHVLLTSVGAGYVFGAAVHRFEEPPRT